MNTEVLDRNNWYMDFHELSEKQLRKVCKVLVDEFEDQGVTNTVNYIVKGSLYCNWDVIGVVDGLYTNEDLPLKRLEGCSQKITYKMFKKEFLSKQEESIVEDDSKYMKWEDFRVGQVVMVESYSEGYIDENFVGVDLDVTGIDWEGDYLVRIASEGFSQTLHEGLSAKVILIKDVEQEPEQSSAEKTLLKLGYQDLGGELWKPPIGKTPDYINDDYSTLDSLAQAIKQAKESLHTTLQATLELAVTRKEQERSVEELEKQFKDLYESVVGDTLEEVNKVYEEPEQELVNDWNNWNVGDTVKCLKAAVSPTSRYCVGGNYTVSDVDVSDEENPFGITIENYGEYWPSVQNGAELIRVAKASDEHDGHFS